MNVKVRAIAVRDVLNKRGLADALPPRLQAIGNRGGSGLSFDQNLRTARNIFDAAAAPQFRCSGRSARHRSAADKATMQAADFCAETEVHEARSA